MVRSGALPTRLLALKYGASLVWGPEMVDKAILHAERVVDPVTGVISYNGKSRAMFTTHPIEKPYLIYQIGTADPELAVQAARKVMQDVSGIDLNCGCPKPFSTHAGMGAALLTNPDLLCSILTALRQAMPPEITVTAKIRLLPTQEETKKLVERIINTGVSAITIHCRTRPMRPREKALQERLNEIVDFVNGLGKDIAVVENGDCTGYDDALRIRRVTKASSIMIATAAESNPSVFSPNPVTNVDKELVPSYLRLARYLDNHWANSKFCVIQFKSSEDTASKAEKHELKELISKGKGYNDMNSVVGEWTGEQELQEVAKAIQARTGEAVFAHEPMSTSAEEVSAIQSVSSKDEEYEMPTSTPSDRPNPEPPSSGAPLGPSNEARMPIPAIISGSDALTPTPTPAAFNFTPT